MRGSLLIAIAMGVALAGCAATDEREARAVAEVFVNAVAEGRYDVACALTTGYEGDCSRQDELVLENLDYRDETMVDEVDVSGDRAVATLGTDGFLAGFECCDPEPIELERVGGEWRVASTIAP